MLRPFWGNDMKKIYLALIIFTALFLGAFKLGFGQEPTSVQFQTGTRQPDVQTGTQQPPQSFSKLQNPIKAKNVTEVLVAVVDLAIFIGVILAVLVFILIGFKFVLAQGNSEKLTEAKKWFLWVIVGLAIYASLTTPEAPETGAKLAAIDCLPEQRGAEICTLEYAPVCGQTDDGSMQTYGNKCQACANEKVISYLQGECTLEEEENASQGQ